MTPFPLVFVVVIEYRHDYDYENDNGNDNERAHGRKVSAVLHESVSWLQRNSEKRMAISEKQRQKKLEQKKKKRQQAAQAARRSSALPLKAARSAHLPIHECLMAANLFEVGIGSVIWARRAGERRLAVSAFMLDVFCLGVKNAVFRDLDEESYEEEMKPSLTDAAAGSPFQTLHPACTRKLIEGAVAYASDLGFQPHRDYRDAKGIFGNVDAGACPTRFEYGRDGKPLYIRGPKESLSQAKRIVEQLDKRCGEGNYHYLIATDDPFEKY